MPYTINVCQYGLRESNNETAQNRSYAIYMLSLADAAKINTTPPLVAAQKMKYDIN